ncbi:MAG: hypothetical protein EB037_13020, partial [Actinobacteria bacterium]|nr:hypothetical protein [Actinomycetota bacterium]
METYGGYGRADRRLTSVRTWRVLLVACAVLAVCVLVGTGTLPADVEPANATGYGCTASGGSTLHEFEYSGTKYCTEEFTSSGTWTRPSWVTNIKL